MGLIRHLKVRCRDGGDGIPWDVLQQIKDEFLGEDVLAIEVFPPAHLLVNSANIRHLWEVPIEMLPFVQEFHRDFGG